MTCSTCRKGRRCRDLEGVYDLLRTAGPLTAVEVADRCVDGSASDSWLSDLASARRVIQVRIAGEPMWAAIEDAGRLRDALGVPLPMGVPEAFTEPVADALGDLVARYARTHGPFATAAVAGRYGLGPAVVTMALRGSRPTAAWSRASSCPRGLGRPALGRTALGRTALARTALARPGPRRAGPNGATGRCCACCAGVAWPGSARRPNRSRRRSWPGSCPPGTGSGPL